ncbi:MAG: hypothetical protein ABW026_19955 [Microvirga sp.]
MLTLILLLVAVGAVCASAYGAAQRPLPPLTEALPVGALGLAWRRVGERQTKGGLKTLWLADAGDESSYSRLYRADRDGMRELGFSWGGDRQGEYDKPVCWEPQPAPSNDRFEAAFARADGIAREEEGRRAAEEAERRARVAENMARLWAQEGEERLAAVSLLRDRMKALPWAWTRSQRDKATAIFAEGDQPSASAAQMARRLVGTCDEMVARVTDRAQTERREKWWALAADPAIQLLVHSATKHLSAMDDDWATVSNDAGWSKAHTALGHVLSGLPRLGQCEASQALWAVHVHRRQIPDNMRRELFGEAA